MKFEEKFPSSFRGEVVHRCGVIDGRMDDGQGVITLAQVS